MSEKHLTAQELSDLTGWSIFTIYKKSSAGQIPGRVKLGASLRFAESKINAWLRSAQKAGK